MPPPNKAGPSTSTPLGPEAPAEEGRRTKPAFLAMQGLRVTGLVGDRDGDGGGAIVVAGHVEVAEPGRPVVVKVAVDADGVGLGGGVHGSGWVC